MTSRSNKPRQTELTLAQLAEQEKCEKAQRALQAKKVAAAQGNPEEFEQEHLEQVQHDEYTEVNLKLRALEKQKAHLTAQHTTKQRAAAQAKKLADAKRKLAEMQAEVKKLQEACEATQAPQQPTLLQTRLETSCQTEAHHLQQTNHINQDHDNHHY